MKTILTLILALSLSGCVTIFGAGGWIASHATVIGEVGLVAGTVAAVEGVTLDTIAIGKEVTKK